MLLRRDRTLGRIASRVAQKLRGRRPVARYAQVLDGDGLWLCLEGLRRPDTSQIALRDPRTAEVQRAHLVPQLGPGQVQGFVSLSTLKIPEHEDAVLELVVLDAKGAQAVRWDADRPPSPTTTPPSSDRRRHYRATDRDGRLTIEVTHPSPVAQICGFSVEDDNLVVTFESPDPSPSAMLLQDEQGCELTTASLTAAAQGRMRVVIRRSAIPASEVEYVMPAIPHGGGWIPLRRRHEDLRHPGTSVVLPAVGGERPDLGDSAVQASYLPNGNLILSRASHDRSESR